MGKPRMIILVRHAQSEGNKNRDIHQTVPDHRVKLTPDGWKQAEEAGIKLRSLLHPTDTLHFFTSPYRRTRETTEGILNALTSPAPAPSPFPRHTIRVYEEPRLREQDFGNFQPDSAEMSRMWQERADYGHFFYRIPNGESAADAYDRVAGFNESLWRSFGEDDFASVCVLVTHGLMTRVFLMKWYHFSVEYFEDLRNVNHCEFVVMRLNADNGKYVLQNQLRTWSELKRERASSKSAGQAEQPGSPVPMRKRWGGCQDGESGDDFARRQRARRQNTADLFGQGGAGGEGEALKGALEKVKVDGTIRSPVVSNNKTGSKSPRNNSATASPPNETSPPPQHHSAPSIPILPPLPRDILRIGRDGGGSRSGAASPNRSGSEDSDAEIIREQVRAGLLVRSSLKMALNGELEGRERVRADALGDQSDVEDEEEENRRGEGREGVSGKST